MKTMLISATSALFIFGTAFAHEVVVGPVVPLHGAIIVERRVAQLSSPAHASGVLCGTKYIATTSSDGRREQNHSQICGLRRIIEWMAKKRSKVR
jgi:hypothetical protein